MTRFSKSGGKPMDTARCIVFGAPVLVQAPPPPFK
jgi:hypothetical protein